MSKKKKMVPQLRFPGYSGEWEERKLSELATFSKGSGYSKADLTEIGKPIILYGRLYTKYETVISEVDTFVSDNTNAVLSEGNEVIVPASGETAEEIARAAVVDKKGIVLGGDLNIIRPKSGIDQTFLALNISNGSQQKEMMKRAQGKSIVHLHNSDLKEVLLKYPCLEEQLKIGKFFNKFDYLIALHQQKLTHLQERKRGLLPKMFPKAGEKVPELRFPGFSGDWEERKLGEVANIIGGGTPKTDNIKYWNGEIDWYSPAEIGQQIYVDHSQKKITELGLKKSSAKILPIGTVLFTSRAGIGSTAILAKEATTNQGFQSIVPIENRLDSYFIYSCTNILKRFGETKGAGSTFIEISGKQMAQMHILLPTIEEQKKIGTFFKQIDNSILLQQQKLDNLKERKKALLQQMFV